MLTGALTALSDCRSGRHINTALEDRNLLLQPISIRTTIGSTSRISREHKARSIALLGIILGIVDLPSRFYQNSSNHV